jgi:hypothetical protein
MGFFDVLSEIGTGIAGTVAEIGTGIAGAADLVFSVAEEVVGDAFGWTDEALGPASNQDTWSAGNLGADGWGSDGWDATQSVAAADTPVSNATFTDPSAAGASSGMLSSGGWITKDDVKGAVAGFAKGYFQGQREDDIMDWRRELELEKIAENKRHHGAYYVKSNVKPAYSKPMEKK